MAQNEFSKSGYKTTVARSRQMAAIRSLNTKPEFAVRRLLFFNGYRYRLHYRILPGRPDIALIKHKVAIFVNGCFWHYHDCHIAHLPKSNSTFWKEKIKRNLERDKNNINELLRMGWRVLIVWECATTTPSKLGETKLFKKIQDFINSSKIADSINGGTE